MPDQQGTSNPAITTLRPVLSDPTTSTSEFKRAEVSGTKAVSVPKKEQDEKRPES